MIWDEGRAVPVVSAEDDLGGSELMREFFDVICALFVRV